MNKNEQLKIVQSHVAQLSEHFDNVQIFCTKTIEDGTINIQYGSGNWFARYGHIKWWLHQEEIDTQSKPEEDDVL